MKFSLAVVTALLAADHQALAFAPVLQHNRFPIRTQTHLAAADMPSPPAAIGKQDLPVVQQSSNGQPADVRYSDFLKLVNADRIEKVTFSADGSQLLGVDVDGARVKIEALPNDPDLLTQLTTHKVCMCHVSCVLSVAVCSVLQYEESVSIFLCSFLEDDMIATSEATNISPFSR